MKVRNKTLLHWIIILSIFMYAMLMATGCQDSRAQQEQWDHWSFLMEDTLYFEPPYNPVRKSCDGSYTHQKWVYSCVKTGNGYKMAYVRHKGCYDDEIVRKLIIEKVNRANSFDERCQYLELLKRY